VTTNQPVSTPNGAALVVAQYFLDGDDYRGEPSGILVRHPKKAEIDPTLCAAEPLSTSSRDGWLVVYLSSQVTPTR
jgi:hypothetical protein